MAREQFDAAGRAGASDAAGEQALLRQALERSAIASCLVAPGGAFLWANDAMCALFGRAVEELTRCSWQELTHPDDVGADQELVDEIIAGTRESFRLLKRYLRPDGTFVWGDLTVTALREPSGALRVLLSQVVDVTAAVARTEQFRLVSENAADFIVESTVDGAVEWVSPSVEQVLGWRADQLHGTRFADLVHPDDRAGALPAEPPVRGAVALPPGFATRVRCADGSYRRLSGRTVTVPRTTEHPTVRVDAWRDVEPEARAIETTLRLTTLLTAELDAELDGRVILAAVRDGGGTIVDFEYVEANPAAFRSMGLTRAELIGKRLSALFPERGPASRLAEFARVAETGEPAQWTARPESNDDGVVTTYLDARIVKVLDGISITWRNVTERVEIDRQRAAAERLLAASEERYRLLAENTADVVVLVKDRRIDWISPSVEREYDLSAAAWLGREASACVAPDDRSWVGGILKAVMAGADRVFRVRAVSPAGETHWVEAHAQPYVDADGSITGLIATCRVIDDLIEVEAELDRRARYDDLTGLLNRSEAFRRIALATTHTPRQGAHTAVLFCDVDHFKDINDAYGHAAGDDVLRALGQRLSSVIRDADHAARIGGDELLVLLPGVRSLADAAAVAEKIRTLAAEPVSIGGGVSVTPQLSIGVTIRRPGETSDQLIERADDAMYLAKKAGRNRVVAID